MTETLADLLDRRVELVDVGYEGGTRIIAEPGVAGGDPTSEAILTAVRFLQRRLVPSGDGRGQAAPGVCWKRQARRARLAALMVLERVGDDLTGMLASKARWKGKPLAHDSRETRS